MKNKRLSIARKLIVLLISVFSFGGAVTAQSVSMSITNCAVTQPNEIQFDVTFTNLTAATVLHWNSTVIRLSYSTGFLVSTADAVVWGYVSGSDFPLSLPPSANPTFISNPAGATKLQLQTGNGIYNNSPCNAATAIAPGATAKIGRFFLRDNTNNFVPGQAVGLTWVTSSGLVLYVDCATTVTNFNTVGTRTLIPPCSLTIPAGCTSPTVGGNPSDQSVCTTGTASFTGSFTGGSPVPTTIWQVQTGGVGLFTDLTEAAPYSGTATNTLTITTPNISLSTNRYRMKTANCTDVFTNSALLTVNPNVTAGTVTGTSPLCIGATATYSSNGTAGGTWSSTNSAVASVNPATGLVTALTAGSTDITYTVGSGCGSPVSNFQSLTVSPNVTAGTVTGTSPLCIGLTATYSSNGTAGGTWSSTNSAVASVNPATGLVTALTAGSTDITYTVGSGCGSPVSNFQSLTVSPNVTAGTVTGTSPLCIGLTATYSSNGTAGGTWSSTNPLIASVDGLGLVTALTAGSTDITYTVGSGCGSPVSNFQSLTVSPNVTAGTVTGTSPLCIGATTTYSSNGTAGGTWSSTNSAVASVNPATGLVTALTAGSTDITYTVGSGCGSPVSNFQSLTVSPNVTAGTVTGTSPLCIGATTTYSSNGTAGGTWSSTNSAVASVNPATGLVTALTAGSTDITYTVSSGCGSPVSNFQSLTVSPNVTAGTVTGTSPLCIGATTTYSSNGTAGGTWSSTNSAVASVNPATGLVTALTAGSTDITYTVGSGCGSPVSNFQSLTVSPNVTAGTVTGTSPLCIGLTATYSSNGTAGGTWSSTNPLVASVDGLGLVTALTEGSTNITYTVSSGCGSPVSNFQSLTTTSFTSLSGIAGGAEICSNASVLPGGTSFGGGSCSLIAKVVPSGVSPVSGNINTCVKIDDVVRTYLNVPYVQRIYNIEPATNAATATATITLYYTQAEFDAYNAARGIYPSIPGGSGDISGINNIRLTQYHGTGTYPGNYNGGPSELIDPVDANIIWNAGAGRWEITFNVTGFSGFYLSSKVTVLPITLLNFSGRNNGNSNLLEWSTTTEQNSSLFEILRSTDGVNFVKAGTVNAAGNSSSTKNYYFNDNISAIGNNIFYYKLRMVDITGFSKLSTTVKIKLNTKGFNMDATPNPFTDYIRINVETQLQENAIFTLNEISGRRIQQKQSQLRKGNNAFIISDLNNIPAGVYLLTITTNSQKQTLKVVKQ